MSNKDIASEETKDAQNTGQAKGTENQAAAEASGQDHHGHGSHGKHKGGGHSEGDHECCGKHGHKEGHGEGGHGKGCKGGHKEDSTKGHKKAANAADGPVDTSIEAQLEAEKARTMEYVDMAQRLKAEFENYKRRTESEKTRIFDFAKGNLIALLLEPLDNFDRALESGKVNEDFEGLLKGVEIINSKVHEILAAEGLTEIDPKGGKFDPVKHEAVMAVESDSHEDDDVVEVFQKGYEFKERVLRHAKVQVAKKK